MYKQDKYLVVISVLIFALAILFLVCSYIYMGGMPGPFGYYPDEKPTTLFTKQCKDCRTACYDPYHNIVYITGTWSVTEIPCIELLPVCVDLDNPYGDREITQKSTEGED